MDIAYDHIAEETYTGDRAATPTPPKSDVPPTNTPASTSSQPRSNLNQEFQETFRAFSSSPWGAKLGGLWGNVRKQGETYYADARREVGEVREEALKGFTDLKETLVNRTRGMSLGEEGGKATSASSGQDQAPITPTATDTDGRGVKKERTESEVIRDNDSLIARFRSEAAKRLKDIEKAEDAADEALLRFGTNIRNFLKDAVSVAPPTEDASSGKQGTEVLFESKDAAGKRVLHTTRLDAQLHVIHTTPEKFTKDPESDEWPAFKEDFMIDERTGRISDDLDRYPELRNAMEQLVPEKVDYADFWSRYYFLRLVLETEEQRRKEMLKGASSQAAEDDDVKWDEDSDDEHAPATPQAKKAAVFVPHVSNDSSTTIQMIDSTSATEHLKPEGRRSHDRQSQPDSDASYDLVSGATSHAPGSPKEEKSKEKRDEESEEEDWE